MTREVEGTAGDLILPTVDVDCRLVLQRLSPQEGESGILRGGSDGVRCIGIHLIRGVVQCESRYPSCASHPSHSIASSSIT